jgi:hypothetical protein
MINKAGGWLKMGDMDVKIHLCTKKELEEEAEEHGSKP